MRIALRLTVPLGFVLIFSSCSDDPAKVEKREKQKVEIVRLKGEIAVIEERIKSMPPDVTEELARTRKDADALNAEATALEKEVVELKARKLAMQNEFDKYRAKYPINK